MIYKTYILTHTRREAAPRRCQASVPILDLMEQGQPSETEAIIHGGILAESLNPGAGFDGHGMRVIRCARFEVAGAADYQPPIWTSIEFEAPASSSDALGQRTGRQPAESGWYANWNSDTEATVVFSGKVFRYPRGDQAGVRKPRHTAVPLACPSRNSTGPTDARNRAFAAPRSGPVPAAMKPGSGYFEGGQRRHRADQAPGGGAVDADRGPAAQPRGGVPGDRDHGDGRAATIAAASISRPASLKSLRSSQQEGDELQPGPDAHRPCSGVNA